MNLDADLLREEPPGYGGSVNDTERTHHPVLKRTPMKLNWNKLHIQSRQEICFGANVSEKMADKSWEKLDRWLQVLLEYSVKLRWKQRIQLCG
jgi:hypothetical protein